MRMGIFASRKIEKNEELTFNYNVDRYGFVLFLHGSCIVSDLAHSLPVTKRSHVIAVNRNVWALLAARLKRILELWTTCILKVTITHFHHFSFPAG